MIVVAGVFDVDLHARAQLVRVFVEGGLKEAAAQDAAFEPLRCRAAHVFDQAVGVDVGRTEQLQRACGAAAFAQRGAFQHHGAGVGAGHAQVGGVGAGVDPAALGGPAKARCGFGCPLAHGDDAVVHRQAEGVDEPVAQLAHGHAVAHGHGACAHEAFPAGLQRQAFDGAARGVGPVEYPHAFAVRGRGLEHVAQRGDEGVDATAQVLQVHQQDVEAVHHLVGGAAHLTVEAEDRDAPAWVHVVGRLDHVVLFVAAQAVLWAKGRAQAHLGQGRERVDAVRELARDRGRVGQQGHASALQWRAQSGFRQQAFDAEFHGVGVGLGQGAAMRIQLARWWKSAWARSWRSAQWVI